jgi:hypothetical protein
MEQKNSGVKYAEKTFSTLVCISQDLNGLIEYHDVQKAHI